MRIGAVLVVALAAAVALGQAESDATQGPCFEISALEWDFGTVWQNDPARGEVTIRNTGDEPLTVETKSSCGCTVTTKPRSPLPPGESDTLTVAYDTLKRTGPAHQTISFNTNDPRRPSTIFQVRGQVRPIYRLEPATTVSFGTVFPDVDETRTVRLVNSYTEPMDVKIKQTVTDTPYQYKLEAVRPGKEWRLDVTPKKPLAAGLARDMLVLETGLARLPKIEIPVYASVRPPISVVPTKLRLPRASVMTMTMRLRSISNPSEPVRIVSAVPSVGAIEVEVVDVPGADGRPGTQEVVVALPPGDQIPEGVEPHIVLRTDCDEPGYREIVVPVEMIGPRPTSR